MARWSRLTASSFAIGGALMYAGACGGSSEVTFRDTDAAAGSGASSASGGQGGSAGSAGSAGMSGSLGRGGAGGTAGNAGVGGSAGRGGTNGSAGTAGVSGSAGRGGTNGSAGTAGASGSAGRGGTSGSAGRGGTSGRGGTNGSAGTAGASGTAGTGGAPDGGTCPSAVPTTGSACAPNGLSCSYGDCCPVSATCTDGHWQVLIPPCVPPVCPSSLPQNGDTCDPCRDASQCRYDRCSADDAMFVANCNPQTRRWQVLSSSCNRTPCGNGGMMCDPDEICVRTEAGTGPNYRCEDDPCAPQPVSCGCAASLCNSFSCTAATNELVTCVCLVCQ